VLVLPAFVLLIWSYLWPTIWQVWNSFRRVSYIQIGTDRNVGWANYDAAFRRGFWSALGYSLTFAAIPLLVVVVAAPALAWAAHRTGTVARWIVRAALALPLVAYVPAAVAMGAVLDARKARIRLDTPNPLAGRYPDPRSIAWAGTFGLVCAIAVTAYLAALRRRDPRRQPWRAMVVVGVLLALAAIAMALQAFTYPYIVTAGGLNGQTRSPLIMMYEDDFRLASLGSGAAVATLLLIPLMLLGIAAAVLIIISRMRIEVDPKYRSADEPSAWPPARIVAVVIGALLLLFVLVATVTGLWPWLSRLGDTTAVRTTAGAAVVNTWAPTLISTFVGVTVAVLAAIGIGALRPLGRYSELLLLPFAPWLFVTTAPLLAPAFNRMAHNGQIDSFLGLVPPTWVAIPVLFIATLLFRGQEARLRAAPAWSPGAVARTLVLPVLPMLAILFGAVWLWQSQDLMWQLVGSGQHRQTGAVAAVEGFNQIFGKNTGVGLVLPVALLVVFVLAAVAAQLAYLDRVAVRVGHEDPDVPAQPQVDHGLPTMTEMGYGQRRL
jgi:ABC-type sugar transport system permease subunit